MKILVAFLIQIIMLTAVAQPDTPPKMESEKFKGNGVVIEVTNPGGGTAISFKKDKDYFGEYVFEQMGKKGWQVIYEFNYSDAEKNIFFPPVVNTGKTETYRLRLKSESNATVEYSIDYKQVPNVEIKSVKVCKKLEFTSETDFAIYDKLGNLITEGRGIFADISGLAPDIYLVKFSNKASEFIKTCKK